MWLSSVSKIFSNAVSHVSVVKIGLFCSPMHPKCLKFCLVCSRSYQIYAEFNWILTAPPFHRKGRKVRLALLEPSRVYWDQSQAGRSLLSSLHTQSSLFSQSWRHLGPFYIYCVPLGTHCALWWGEWHPQPGSPAVGLWKELIAQLERLQLPLWPVGGSNSALSVEKNSGLLLCVNCCFCQCCELSLLFVFFIRTHILRRNSWFIPQLLNNLLTHF